MEEIRIFMTVAAFSSFLGIVCWAYTPRRKQTLDAVAASILKDDA
jgi:cbb3-type cytochrome oxidase subunit 3